MNCIPKYDLQFYVFLSKFDIETLTKKSCAYEISKILNNSKINL